MLINGGTVLQTPVICRCRGADALEGEKEFVLALSTGDDRERRGGAIGRRRVMGVGVRAEGLVGGGSRRRGDER